MPTELTFELDELSLVDEPANKEARVTIFKRAEPQPASNNLDQIFKAAAEHAAIMRSLLNNSTTEVRTMSSNFETRVSELQTNEKLSKNAAMQKAAELYPEEFKAYQEEGAASSRPTFQKAAPHAVIRKFDELVETEVRKGLSYTAAMQAVALAHPDALQLYNMPEYQ